MTARGGGGGGGAIAYSYSSANAHRRQTQLEPAPNMEQLGTKMIEGVSAEGTRTTITIPAGQIGNGVADIVITHERWYSPDLADGAGDDAIERSAQRCGDGVIASPTSAGSEPMPSSGRSAVGLQNHRHGKATPRGATIRKDE